MGVGNSKPESVGGDMMRKNRGLYRSVYSDENLTEAWYQVRTRGTETSGADGITLTQFQRYLFRELRVLQRELAKGQYKPLPIKITTLKKTDGSYRPIGILAVRDRVAQRAVLNVIEPVFEAEFEPTSFGFRPGRSREMAMDYVAMLVNRGLTWTVHFDIERCFESIDLNRLRKAVAAKIRDKALRRILEAWLSPTAIYSSRRKSPFQTVPVEGLVQGSPLSPLLANVYLDQFDKSCRRKAIQIVRFADDVLLLAHTQREAKEHFAIALKILRRLKLRVNSSKTRFAHVEEGLEFLGGTLVFDEETGTWMSHFPEKEEAVESTETPVGRVRELVFSAEEFEGSNDGDVVRG